MVMNHAHVLKIVSGSNKSQAVAMLELITDEQLKMVCEVFSNIRHGIIPLEEKDLKLMKKNKNFIRQLTAQGIGRKRRKELLKKHKLLTWKILKTVRHHLLD